MANEMWTREHDARLARALGHDVIQEPGAIPGEYAIVDGYITREVHGGGEVRIPATVPVPDYSNDLAAVFEAQAEIERRGLSREYAIALLDAVWSHGYLDHMSALINATAEQRAWALLATLEGQDRG